MIKTFRGQIVDGATDTIVLHTNDGSTGYRIVKFQVIDAAPGIASIEAVVSISKVSFTPVATIDFSNNQLLGSAFYAGSSTANNNPTSIVIIFDNEIFNQDIYIGNAGATAGTMNYYLELEQVKLDLSESTVATLKNIRNEKRIAPG